ncbi:MAG TPA: outer membrane protein assembly factor BamA [Thermoanaerobaculia bacterium]|nr:outer membrane protein assembly factor BamA [Thermoanaerobaculia bacterium]
MKRSSTIALLIVLLTAATAPAQPAGEVPPGTPIDRIEVVGNQSVARDTIRVYLGLEPGDPYDPAALRRNFLNLWQTGLFDDIRIEAEPTAAGALVRVIVRERPRIGAVEFRGNKNLSLTKINEALEAARLDLHVGNTIEQTLVQRAVETIREAYAENGFEGVTVETLLEEMIDPAERRIVFQISEGIKAKVAAIAFVGNERFSDRRLRREMDQVKRHNLYTWVRKKNVYVPSKLDEDIERIRNLYLDYGYKDVTFGDPEITTTRRERVRIRIPINEGDVHQFGEVSVAGNTVFTQDQLIGNWPLETGQTLSRKPIQNRIDLFEEAYNRRGYIYAYINSEYVEVDGNVVNVHLQVFEGEQFRLGRLEFKGNTVTKDKVLRREIFLDEGDIMDMETFKASMYKLGQLGYFKVTENPDFQVRPESKTVDITIKGQEEGKNDIQFGGGYSDAYGFFGQLMFATRNFLGEGENLGVSFQQGAQQNFFSLSYADPWFLDRPHSFGISLFDRDTQLPDSIGIQSHARGGTVAYGFRLDRFESISFLYALQDVDERNQFIPAPDENGNVPLPRIQESQFTTSTFVPSYRYDSRDNPFDTFRGAKTSVTVNYSGGPLGGTVNLIKPVVNFTSYRPLSRRSSVSFNLEAGQIFPTDDEDCAHFAADLDPTDFSDQLCVPFSERFFVGGEYSVRGFRSYTLVPREEVNGIERRVGGYKYSVFNLEYLYRVNDPLRLVLFADAGQSYAYKEEFDLSKLRYSAGAELRIFLPVFQFPLRFIYAVNLEEQPDDEFQSFQFSIGNTF